MNIEEKKEQAGRAAYNAYCGTRDWKSFRGEALPQWEESPEDIRAGWREAAFEVLKLEGLWKVREITEAGFAGVLAGVGIVDRRIHPEAIPIPANALLGVPEPAAGGKEDRTDWSDRTDRTDLCEGVDHAKG